MKKQNLITEKRLKKWYKWVYEICLMPSEHFVHLYYDKNIPFLWNNDVSFVLTHHDELEFYNTSSPKHQSTSINQTRTHYPYSQILSLLFNAMCWAENIANTFVLYCVSS